MTSPATAFVDDAAVTAREAEVPDANFDNGMNVGGSNAPGIGVNMLEGAIVGTPNQFTLLDQQEPDGVARVPQISQCIGGYPYTDPANYPSSDGTVGTLPDAVVRYGAAPTQAAKDSDPALDGTIIITANATLSVLATGWEANA